MKIEYSEKAPSGRIRLACFLSNEDLQIMHSLLENSLKHTPLTEGTAKTRERMKAMHRSLVKYFKSPFHEPTPDKSKTL